MKKTLKSMICIALCFFTLVLAGCAGANAPSPSAPEDTATPETAQTASAEPSEEPKAETRTVKDATDRDIVVPAQIDRIAIISTMPLASVYCMVGGDPAKIVALTPESKNAAVNSFLIRVAPELESVSTAFAEGETVNVEEIMSLDPDVIFYNTNNEADCTAVEQLEKLSVPCVGFSTSNSNTIGTVSDWATLAGDVLGTQMQAEDIVKFGRETESMIEERVSSIPEEERRSALILANYTENAIVAAGSTFGRYWLSETGAINVAADIEQAISPVSLEQIYEWNPEVILLNSFSAFTAEEVAAGTAVEGQDWSGLTAVKNGELYKMPLGMYYWFPPCSDSPLSLMWIAKHIYPEQFSDIDMDAEIKEYYSRFYGIELTDEDLEKLYNPPAESAMVY